ncbi:hypothetical protein ODJ79_46760 [Actinoplanes sp. KI2]|uniref:DUF6959 family protein n=1 Tax=Actinoplanes sp. KI2 TaxID=2983315 RepID=UPI0021D5C135|nr:hypothetical protein [Actinoplanes sp. KI2]MCU7731259.1 hypothetical protein [Actinoplanes sp. KI2]
MDQEDAAILSRAGNWAVVHMPGRRFPGIQLQGDTFAGLRAQLAAATRSLHARLGDLDALDDLDNAVQEMDAILAFYEQTLAERGFERPCQSEGFCGLM